MIKEAQRMAILRNPAMAAATLAGAQADAMKTAAGNAGGAMTGFMGMNMAGMTGGFKAQNLYAMGQQQAAQAQQMACLLYTSESHCNFSIVFRSFRQNMPCNEQFILSDILCFLSPIVIFSANIL